MYMKNEEEELDYINKECKTNYSSLEEVDWWYISVFQKLSEDFIREFQDKVWWSWISEYQKLSEDFIREFQDKVDWRMISRYQTLSEEFIREFADKVNWYYISMFEKLSEPFIREFQDTVDWKNISTYQKLSERFIQEFQDNFDWYSISTYQKLSEDFLREYKDKVNWWYISRYQKLSEDFIREFNINNEFGDVKGKSWLYKDKEFLKQQVIESGLYECHEDYFIAYKGIKKDRYSKFNFQYQYFKGETYEAHCDCTDEENSFGLSVWTEEQAKNYCDELIVRVKVNYEDVGRLVHDNGKIRVRKLTVLD